MTFNALLENEGIDPKTVRLARHKDNTFKVTPYSIWRTNRDAYLTYNKTQRVGKFDNADFIASFVVLPTNETLFARIYRLNGVGEVPSGTICPVSEKVQDKEAGVVFYDLFQTDYLTGLEGRVIVDWGEGERAWVQWANKNPKPVQIG